MKVITYYELLGLIKDGKYPNIKYKDSIFKWDGFDYVDEDDELKSIIYTCNWFERILEILDEEDEFIDIEELRVKLMMSDCASEENQEYLNEDLRRITDKFNDLIKNQKKIIEKLKEE